MTLWLIILAGVSGVLAMSALLLVIAPAVGGAIHGRRFNISPFAIAAAAVFVPLFLASLYWLGIFA